MILPSDRAISGLRPNPPRNGEVAARRADGGVGNRSAKLCHRRGPPLRHALRASPPPRSGEDFEENVRMQGKVAIVTGAAGGIGEAIVRKFGEKGVKVHRRRAHRGEALGAAGQARHGDGVRLHRRRHHRRRCAQGNRRQGDRALRPARYRGQQRRLVQFRTGARDHRRDARRSARHFRARAVPPLPRGAGAHGPGQLDPVHRLDLGDLRHAGRRRLQLRQGRPDRPRPDHGGRIRAAAASAATTSPRPWCAPR